MALPAFVLGAFGLANKALNAYIAIEFIDYLTGGNVGNLINKYVFGKQTTQPNKNNLGLNDRLLNLKNTGTPTQGGALKFLGDGGKKLDDAPDIVPTNQSVLDSIAINQGLAMGNTMVPEIDNTSSTQSGFAGLREEIDKINQNIQAIATAMLTSSAIESSYRQELLDDLEKSLAKKGKVRSQTRTERSIFNTITRQKDKIVTKTGNLANDVANALALSLGLEAAGAFANFFDDDKEEREPFDPDTTIIKKEVDEETGEVTELTANEFNKKTYYIDQNGVVRFKKNDVPAVLWNISATEEDKKILDRKNYKDKDEVTEIDENKEKKMSNIPPEEGSNKQFNPDFGIESREKENTFNINQQEGDKDLSQSISAISNNVAFSPLESMSGTTQIIDLRTAKDVSGQSGPDIGGASTVIDSEIADLVPERRVSPYETLVRSV